MMLTRPFTNGRGTGGKSLCQSGDISCHQNEKRNPGRSESEVLS